MHIAFVISQDLGGLPHYAAELANAVSEYAEVTVFKPSDKSADNLFSDNLSIVDIFRPAYLSLSELRRDGISPIQTLVGLGSYWRLRQIREYDPDAVHIVTNLFPQVQLFSWLYRLDTEYPFALTLHDVRPGSVTDDTKSSTSVFGCLTGCSRVLT